MKKYKASVSIFLSFILIMVISVILSITEIARIKILRLYFQIYSDIAVDSMLSLYHRRLWDYYRIFGVENENYKHLIISYVRSIIFLWLPDGGKAIPLLPATSFL